MNPALDALRRRASALGERIVSGTGASAVKSIFGGGAVATGRVAWYQGDDLEILSDIDLYVVADAAHLADVRRVAVAAGELDAEPGVRFMRRDDIGVYTLDDLLSQPSRPGTVALADQHYHVFGDEAVFEHLRASIPAAIEPDEGMYLLENRIAELPPPGTAADAATGRLWRYRLARTVLDTAAACLIGAGRYDGSRAVVDQLDGAEAAGLPGWNESLVRRAQAARADLATFLGAPENPLARDEVLAFALEAWRGIAAGALEEDPEDWGALVIARCGIGDYKRNFREFLAMSAARGRSRRRMAWTGAHLSRYSPVAALRLAGLVATLLGRDDVDAVSRRTLEGVEAYLDRLTDAFGCSDGSLAERVACVREGA